MHIKRPGNLFFVARSIVFCEIAQKGAKTHLKMQKKMVYQKKLIDHHNLAPPDGLEPTTP